MTKRALQHTPYPVSKSGREIVGMAALMAAIVYFLLIVFQPFGTYNFPNEHKCILLLPYAVIAFIVFAAADWVLRKRAGDWLLHQELTKTGTELLLCSVLSYGYNARFVNHMAWSWSGLGYMTLFTFALGVPAMIIHLLVRYVRLQRKEAAPAIPEPILPVPEGSASLVETLLEVVPLEATAKTTALPALKTLQIKPLVGAPLVVSENDLLAAESAGNYCYVFYLQRGALRKELLRIPIKELETQVGSQTIIRCHRSFIVNTAHIIRAKGNAQGGHLSITHLETPVPVSRTYAALLQKLLPDRKQVDSLRSDFGASP